MRIYKTGAEAREAIRRGVNKAADVVKVTLGPAGNTVILGTKFGSPNITDDGVTVARDFQLPDEFEQIGVSLIQEIATKTNDVAGDGTTTATVLAQSLVNVDTSLYPTKSAPIKVGMDKAVDAVVAYLKTITKPCKTQEAIREVAFISSLDSEVADTIADIYKEVGHTGVITAEDGQSIGLEKEVVKGLRFDRGIPSPYLITQGQDAVWNQPAVLVTTQKIQSFTDLLNILPQLVDQDITQLVILADEIEPDVLTECIRRHLLGTIHILPLQLPGFGEYRESLAQDIAAVTGAKVIEDLKTAKFDDLGSARKVVTTKGHTTIIDGMGDTTERVAQLKSDLNDTTSQYDKLKVEERIASLTGGIGIIKVGAYTETEAKARKYKIEDALNATKAAIEEGIIPGGGLALYEASINLTLSKYEQVGADAVLQAIKAPLNQIAENLGILPTELIDLIKADPKIVDPLKVTRLALQNATSIASTILTSQAVIVDKHEEKTNTKDT